MKLQESSIIINLVQTIREKGYEITNDDAVDIIGSYFACTAEFLGKVKNKNQKIAVTLTDIKGNLIVAAIVSYHPNEEDENKPGNWSLEFTTEEADLEGVTIYDTRDPQFQQITVAVMNDEFGITISDPAIKQIFFEEAVKGIFKWLDINIKEDEEVEVEHENFFVASGALENGEKIISIVPDGAIKRAIKGDADIESR